MFKKFERLKFVPAIALALVVFMMTAAPAFATTTGPNGLNNQTDLDNGPGGTAVVNADGGVGAVMGTETDPAQAAITKVLQMPVGTTAPAATFKFTATPVSVSGTAYDSGNSTAGIPPNMPDLNIPAAGLTYPGGTAATADTNTATYTQETGDILDGVVFPHAGIYVYTIAETSGTYPAATGETMVYSPAEYTLNVFVANGSSGPYVQAVGDVIATQDNGSQDLNYKVDPTPGGDGTTYLHSQMVFTNTFMRTHQGTITDPNLEVSKKVTGSYADLTLYFEYTMKVTAPDVSYDPTPNLPDSSMTPDPADPINNPPLVPFTATAPTYTAYILDSAGAIITDPTPNSITGATFSTTTGLITITSGTEFKYSLQNGQKLVFLDTPVGTTFTANETGTPGYEPSLTYAANNTSGAAATGTTTPATPVAGKDLSTGTLLVSEGNPTPNKADYTNNLPDITPTGILISNLPFIIMIVVVVGALVAFIAVKSRKRKSYNN